MEYEKHQKNISTFLTGLLLMTAGVMAAEPEADGETVLTDNKYLPILSGLGIITMFEDGSYHLEDTFTVHSLLR